MDAVIQTGCSCRTASGACTLCMYENVGTIGKDKKDKKEKKNEKDQKKNEKKDNNNKKDRAGWKSLEI